MKILIVCSATNQQVAPFIKEQADSLLACGQTVEFYLIRKKGVKGYLDALSGLKSTIAAFRPDIIHAHYGLSGLLANLQRKVPVVTTFHGSDINDPRIFRWSRWAIRLSRYAIFVSQQAVEIAKPRQHYAVLPCGVNMNRFYPVEKKIARQQLGWNDKDVYILFAGAREVEVKNYPLALQAVRNIPGAQLVELKGFDRDEVNCPAPAAPAPAAPAPAAPAPAAPAPAARYRQAAPRTPADRALRRGRPPRPAPRRSGSAGRKSSTRSRASAGWPGCCSATPRCIPSRTAFSRCCSPGKARPGGSRAVVTTVISLPCSAPCWA